MFAERTSGEPLINQTMQIAWIEDVLVDVCVQPASHASDTSEGKTLTYRGTGKPSVSLAISIILSGMGYILTFVCTPVRLTNPDNLALSRVSSISSTC
jgi:hypothetical protein